MILRTLMLAGLAVLVACGGESPTEPDPTVQDIRGTWEGQVENGGPDFWAHINQSETGWLTGGADMETPEGDLVILTLEGNYDPPDAHITFGATHLGDIIYDAQAVHEDTLRGTLSGGGMDGDRLTLVKTFD